MGKIIKHSIIENVPFWVFAGVAIIMGIISFFMPPKGDIMPSVLKFTSWMFAFAALWTVFVAMKRGLDARIQHGKTAVTVGSLEGKPSGKQTEDDDDDDDED